MSSSLSNLKKSLSKCVEDEDTEGMLQVLVELQSPTMTQLVSSATLKETRIGKTVGKLRKHKDERVAKLSTQLVSRWKELVGSSSTREESTPPKTVSETPKEDKKRKLSDMNTEVEKKDESPKEEKAGKAPKTDSASPKSSTAGGDAQRKKIIKMLADALGASDPKSSAIGPKSEQIEEELFQLCGSADKNYKQKFRSLVFNLKKNDLLRKSVLDGTISPARLVKMGPLEMAPKELAEERKRIEEYHLAKVQAQAMVETSTDMFRCGKCGKRETTYHQLQTRSADEPMTTFHTCTNCGNRWRSQIQI